MTCTYIQGAYDITPQYTEGSARVLELSWDRSVTVVGEFTHHCD